MSAAPSLASPPLPRREVKALTLETRFSLLLDAAKRLAPGRLCCAADEERALWAMLLDALRVAAVLAEVGYETPLGGVPRTVADAHTLWSETAPMVLDRLTARVRGLGRTRSALTEHAEGVRHEFKACAARVTRLFEDLTERRA